MLHAVLTGDGAEAGLGATATTFVVVIILSGLAAVVALVIYGIRTFWGGGLVPSRIHVTEVVPIGTLLLACVLLTLYAGTVFSYLERTGDGLRQPAVYIERVMSAPVVETAGGERQ
jgi:multicomponent K+:H+ antiporter subunit D